MDPNCASGCVNCRETLGNQRSIPQRQRNGHQSSRPS